VIAFVVFAAPLLLIALAAMAIPLVLHLIYRLRAPQLPFSAVQFLQQAVKRTVRRRRLENFTLLALRCCLLGLLATALALPFYKSGNGGFAGRSTAAVIILDNSMSMALRRDDQAAFESARLAALHILRGYGRIAPPELAALIVPCALPENRTFPMTGELTRLADAIRAVKVSHAKADLSTCIIQADRMLQDSPTANKLIYLLTDLQAHSIDVQRLRRINQAGEPAHLMVINVGQGQADNLAIEDLRIPLPAIVGLRTEIQATVRNYSPVPQQASVELLLKDATTPLASRLVDLSPAEADGDRRRITFSLPLELAGSIWGHLAIKPQEDPLPPDNRVYFAGTVLPAINAAVVCDVADGDEAWQADPAFYLKTALRLAAAIKLDLLSPQQLDRLDLAAYSVIFLIETGRIGEPAAEALKQWLAATPKATLIVFLDARLALQGTSPVMAKLALPHKLAEGDAGPLAAVLPQESPLLNEPGFAPAAYRQWTVQRYVKLSLPGALPAETILRLENGDPLIVQAPLGTGRVIVFATDSQADSSNLPLLPIFPAMMLQACLDSVEQSGWRITEAGQPILLPSAGPIELSLPGSQRPRPTTAPATAAASVTAVKDTYVAGIYRWTSRGELRRWGVFAVNPPAEESNLAAIDPNQLRRDVPSCLIAGSLDQLAEHIEELETGKPLWDYLLAVALIFMIIETALANRTRPRKAA